MGIARTARLRPRTVRQPSDRSGGAMPKLTKRFVESVKPEATDQLIFDEKIPGFGLRVKRKTGVRSYVVQYRNQQGRSRRLTIGKHGKLKVMPRRWLDDDQNPIGHQPAALAVDRGSTHEQD